MCHETSRLPNARSPLARCRCPRGAAARDRHGAAGGKSAAEDGRPGRGHVLLRPAHDDACEGGGRDRLSCHQRDQASAARIAPGAVYGQGGGGRPVRCKRPDRPVARGLSAEDAPPAGWASHVGRSAAHRGRGDHLRRLREPGCPARGPANPRARAADVPRPGVRAAGRARADRLRRRRAGLRHDTEADRRDHAGRGRGAGGRGRGLPALPLHQGGRGPVSESRLLAGRRADAAGGGGDRARARAARRQGDHLRPARHRCPARDPRDGPRRSARPGRRA